jgi:hypothetical protein
MGFWPARLCSKCRAAKLNALKVARATGDLPENINFAIKTGVVRDVLDNSAVPYQTAESLQERQTADIAVRARGYTMLISCSEREKIARGADRSNASQQGVKSIVRQQSAR